MEKREYFLQSPMPLGLEKPAINIMDCSKPIRVWLTEADINFLNRLVSGLKIVEIVPPPAHVPVPPPLPEPPPVTEPTPVVTEQAPDSVTPVATSSTPASVSTEATVEAIPAETTTAAPEEAVTEQTTATVQSKNMKATEAIEYMKTLPVDQLSAFLSPNEDRKGVLEAHNLLTGVAVA